MDIKFYKKDFSYFVIDNYFSPPELSQLWPDIKRLGKNFFLTNHENNINLEKKFEVISFIDSLAHIPNFFVRVNNIIRNHLQPNGLIVIRTPSFTNAYLKYSSLMCFFLPRKTHKSLYYYPSTYALFNECSIKVILSKLNLSILFFDKFKDYQLVFNSHSIKEFIGDVIINKIPSMLKLRPSMFIIARYN